MVEMTFNAPTNAGNYVHVMLNIACARSQCYINNSVFLLAQTTLRTMTLLSKFPPFVRSNIISNSLTDGLLIYQLDLVTENTNGIHKNVKC